MTNAYQIECLTTPAQLLPLRDEWNRLAQGIPFRRWEWLEAWYRHYAKTGDQLFTVTVRDAEGRLVGLAPWYRAQSLRHGLVVRFLGDGEVCSDHLTILAEPDQATPVLAALGEWLAGSAQGQWDLLELVGADTGDPCVSALLNTLQNHGHRLHQRPGLNRWQLPLTPQLDDIVNALSRSRRDKARKLLRKVIGTGRAVPRAVETVADLGHAFHLLVDLHQRRWQAAGLPGCFASRPFTRFHREVVERLLTVGALRLHWMELDGQPVSIAYELLGTDATYCYQMGYDPDFAQASPGWLQVLSSLRGAIDSGHRLFDFMRGDEPYKKSWGAEAVPTTEYRVVGRGAAASLRHAAWRTEQRLRSWARQLRNRAAFVMPVAAAVTETA